MNTMVRFAVLSALLIASSPILAAVFTANSSLDLPDNNPGDGLCRSDGVPPSFCTLRAAIMEANALPGNHTIRLQPDRTYTLTRVGNDNTALNGDLDLLKAVTIECDGCAANGSDWPTVNANGIDRVFDIRSGGVRLRQMTITGGYLTGSAGGAGVYIENNVASAQLQSLRFIGNRAADGSAVLNLGASVDIEDAEFFDNQTSGSPSFGNVVTNIGGMTIDRGFFHLNNMPGGHSSQAVSGRGSNFINIYNTTISGNAGYGIRIQGISNHIARVRNVTIVDNGNIGLSVIGGADSQNLVLRNSIIAHNTVTNQCGFPAGHAFDLDGYNLATHASCGLAAGATNLPITDPLLTPLKYRNSSHPTPVHWPRPDSPVLSAGTLFIGADCRPVDQHGIVRPQGYNGIARCDLGAAEVPDDAIFFDSLETL